MSRTKALWLSAILTLAIVLIAGTMLLRPTVSRSTLAQEPAATSLISDGAAGPLNVSAQQVTSWQHGDDDDQYEHHESHEEHDDDD
jgi:hypothetical protein